MARARLNLRKIQGEQLSRIYRDDIGSALLGIFDFLHLPVHPEELALVDERSILLIYGGLDDYIAEVGFVVQCQKDNAFRRTRSLLYGDLSCGLDWLARLSSFSVVKSREIHLLQILSSVSQRVRADGESRDVMVRDETFNVTHAQENRRGVVIRSVME